jgi:hypothetical protein
VLLVGGVQRGRWRHWGRPAPVDIRVAACADLVGEVKHATGVAQHAQLGVAQRADETLSHLDRGRAPCAGKRPVARLDLVPARSPHPGVIIAVGHMQHVARRHALGGDRDAQAHERRVVVDLELPEQLNKLDVRQVGLVHRADGALAARSVQHTAVELQCVRPRDLTDETAGLLVLGDSHQPSRPRVGTHKTTALHRWRVPRVPEPVPAKLGEELAGHEQPGGELHTIHAQPIVELHTPRPLPHRNRRSGSLPQASV